MAILSVPGYDLQPSSKKVAVSSNYLTDFDFLNQYLPDVHEQEFERYGNRSVASFLRRTSGEKPFASDLVKWTEQGRLHTKYTACTVAEAAATDEVTVTVGDSISGSIAIREGQTILLENVTTAGSNKGVVTSTPSSTTFTVAFYEAGGLATNATPGTDVFTVMVYGSEFKKGTDGMSTSLESETNIFENSPIILKDAYEVSGSDMSQIGWVDIATEGGETGYLWYLKSLGDTRTRFDDYCETSLIEAVPAEAGSGALTQTTSELAGNKGSEGLFYVIGDRGNVWDAGFPDNLTEFDTIVSRLDKQGAIEENVIFDNREFSFAIDDMLATLNGYNGSGAANAASFGLFQNSADMALNLGFSGFRRGYDFYKTDWKYLNDPTMRGDLASGKISGVLAPAGSTTIYDNMLGKNAKLPFLHVRYRVAGAENRKYKTWATGSAGGAKTSSIDAMKVDFLTERLLTTLGANNFFIFQG